MPRQPLRMIDANLNRSSEGLRVLEDVARFLLNDAGLSQQLRAIRHNLAEETKSLSTKLLSQRDSEHDVGHPHVPCQIRGAEGRASFSLVPRQIKGGVDEGHPVIPLPSRERDIKMETASPKDLADLVRANAKRVEESLRVMEELAKLPEINSLLNSAKFEQARFTLYALERELLSRVLRQDKIKRIGSLYVILDRQVLAGRDELATASQIIEGGARVIQLRDKQSNKRELLPIAQKLKDLCAKAGILFIINDYLDIALAINADGLHIGQGDLPLPTIRKELPIDKIIGCSVSTVSQAIRAQEEGADYIAVGSIFPTTTKTDATVVGIDRLKEVKEKVSCPLVAIGGINEENVGRVLAAGADSIAVISAVLGKEDIKGAVERLIAETSRKCQSQ